MGKCVQRMDQELADVNLTILVDVLLVLATVVCSILEYLVNILVLTRIAFQCELQEGRVQV